MKTGGWEMIQKSGIKFFRECLLMIGFSLFAAFPLLKYDLQKGKTWRWIISKRIWLLFILTGIFMIPVSFYSILKVGGSNNTFIYTNYFLLVGVLLAYRQMLSESNSDDSPPLALWRKLSAGSLILLISILMVIYIPVVYYRIATLKNKVNFGQVAYEYAKENPGEVYFPRLTLINLVTEKKLYHTTDGILDRNWAKIPVSLQQLQAHVPPKASYMVFTKHGEHRKDLFDLPQFSKEVSEADFLPDFYIYKRVAPNPKD